MKLSLAILSAVGHLSDGSEKQKISDPKNFRQLLEFGRPDINEPPGERAFDQNAGSCLARNAWLESEKDNPYFSMCPNGEQIFFAEGTSTWNNDIYNDFRNDPVWDTLTLAPGEDKWWRMRRSYLGYLERNIPDYPTYDFGWCYCFPGCEDYDYYDYGPKDNCCFDWAEAEKQYCQSESPVSECKGSDVDSNVDEVINEAGAIFSADENQSNRTKRRAGKLFNAINTIHTKRRRKCATTSPVPMDIAGNACWFDSFVDLSDPIEMVRTICDRISKYIGWLHTGCNKTTVRNKRLQKRCERFLG